MATASSRLQWWEVKEAFRRVHRVVVVADVVEVGDGNSEAIPTTNLHREGVQGVRQNLSENQALAIGKIFIKVLDTHVVMSVAPKRHDLNGARPFVAGNFKDSITFSNTITVRETSLVTIMLSFD
jgi:hypothetical protein